MADQDGEAFDESSELTLEEKTLSDASETTLGQKRSLTSEELDEKNKNRGNYRCSRCNLPKKGHVCPFQHISRKSFVQSVDVEVQAELDSEMTVAKLGPLDRQGTDESYLRSDDESPADRSAESAEKKED